VPLLLTGDLNTACIEELSGVARGVAVVTGGMDKVHPALAALRDAPTPPTTRTDARELRIDYVLYQATRLQLRGLGRVPTLAAPIPCSRHPSDHLPVVASLTFTSEYAVLEELARTWLLVVTGAASSARPLLPTELQRAFTFYDKDGSGAIQPYELESALSLLSCPSPCSAASVRAAIAAVPGNGPAAPPLTFPEFSRAFVFQISQADSSTWVQLRFAYHLFDEDGDGALTLGELRRALDRMAPAPIAAGVVDLIFAELDTDGDAAISIDEWIDFCRRRYAMSVAGASSAPRADDAPDLLPTLPLRNDV